MSFVKSPLSLIVAFGSIQELRRKSRQNSIWFLLSWTISWTIFKSRLNQRVQKPLLSPRPFSILLSLQRAVSPQFPLISSPKLLPLQLSIVVAMEGITASLASLFLGVYLHLSPSHLGGLYS